MGESTRKKMSLKGDYESSAMRLLMDRLRQIFDDDISWYTSWSANADMLTRRLDAAFLQVTATSSITSDSRCERGAEQEMQIRLCTYSDAKLFYTNISPL